MASQRAKTSEIKVIVPNAVRDSSPCSHPVRKVNDSACVAAKRSAVDPQVRGKQHLVDWRGDEPERLDLDAVLDSRRVPDLADVGRVPGADRDQGRTQPERRPPT